MEATSKLILFWIMNLVTLSNTLTTSSSMLPFVIRDTHALMSSSSPQSHESELAMRCAQN